MKMLCWGGRGLIRAVLKLEAAHAKGGEGWFVLRIVSVFDDTFVIYEF